MKEQLTAEQAREISSSVVKTLEDILYRVQTEAQVGRFTCPYKAESITPEIRRILWKLGYNIQESESTPGEYVWIDWMPNAEKDKEDE